MQARVIIFGMQVDNGVLYHGIGNQPSHAYYYPLAQQSCGGDIGSVSYVCTYVRSFVRSYVHLLSSL